MRITYLFWVDYHVVLFTGCPEYNILFTIFSLQKLLNRIYNYDIRVSSGLFVYSSCISVHCSFSLREAHYCVLENKSQIILYGTNNIKTWLQSNITFIIHRIGADFSINTVLLRVKTVCRWSNVSKSALTYVSIISQDISPHHMQLIAVKHSQCNGISRCRRH